jgi:hypothetical protein
MENTMIVEDNPTKHVLNVVENVILPKSGTFVGAGQSNTYLIDMLPP